MNAALIVKNSDGNWEVAEKYNLPESKLSLLLTAHENKDTIVGMITSAYEDTAVPGATWNGSSFSGGTKLRWMDNPDLAVDWSVSTTYSLLINNVIFIVFNNVKNDLSDDKMKAIFSSEVSMVPFEENRYLNLGTIWDGQDFLTGV
jgi:hypothetical protein